MKNFLKIWLIAFLPLVGFGQTIPITGTVDLSNYPTRAEMQKAIADAIGKPIEPALPACKAGPIPVAITKITTTSANVTFHADDVHVIDWRIVSVSDTTILYSKGVANPTTNQFPIAYAGLAPGQYKLMLDGVDCKGHGSRNFTVPVPEVVIKNCPRGPDIQKIENFSSSGLTAFFDGEGVEILELEIRHLNGPIVEQNIIKPSSSKLVVEFFEKLSPGQYQVRTKGVSCKGDSEVYKYFTIPDLSGGGTVTPPVIVVPPVEPTGFPVTIVKGLDDHLKLDWKKSGEGYLVSDIANPGIGGEYEFRYMIGGNILKTGKAPLTNYRVEGFNPVRIIKYKIKPGKVLNQWEEERGSYFDRDAGQTFSYNTSIAYHNYIFPGIKGDFVSAIPSNYNPLTQNTQWGDISPDMKLPKGHVYVQGPRPWSIEHGFKKGITHVSNFQLPWENPSEVVRLRNAGLTYNDVQRIETVFKIHKSGNTGELWPDNTSKDWWPNGAPSEQEGYEIAMRADIDHALWISEMSENESWLPPDSPAFRGFYRGMKERYVERFTKRGIPYYMCHDYIWLGGIKLNQGDNANFYKRILSLPPDQQPKNDYTPGGTLTSTNLIVETVYLNAPDMYIAQPYELIFRLEYINQLGYTAGAFLAGVHEWKPNNLQEIKYPEGSLYPGIKLPLDPNVHIANGFLSQVFGKLFIEWGGNGKTSTRKVPATWYATTFQWFPNGATSPQDGFPYFKPDESGENYYGYSGSVDMTHFSQVLFANTYGPVEGGRDKYLRYRLDGGAWINPSDKDYIDAYFGKRGFVHSRTLNGKTAFFFLNSFADNTYHKLEVELPDGTIWSGRVSGNGIHAKLL